MIEARTGKSTPEKAAGTAGAKGLSAEDLFGSPTGEGWAVGEHPPDCHVCGELSLPPIKNTMAMTALSAVMAIFYEEE